MRYTNSIYIMHATYGLIGYPLGHSFSKGYFTHFFEENRIDAEYKNFELPSIEELTTVLREEPALRGFNVTIPYKQAVIPYLDEMDEKAKAIGAAAGGGCARCRAQLHHGVAGECGRSRRGGRPHGVCRGEPARGLGCAGESEIPR